MTPEQIVKSADLWRRNLNTAEIAALMMLPEHNIANNLWQIIPLARDRREKGRLLTPIRQVVTEAIGAPS